MAASRSELHRLVDVLPQKEILAAKRFLEFLLGRQGKELTPKELAERLNTTPMRIRKLLREGKLPGRKVGQEWWVREHDLEDFLDPDAYCRAKGLGSGCDTG
ncbi:MAG: helix-turn-helix domain-containing protein [Bacillota bacterium]